jgi:hypothetical protein
MRRTSRMAALAATLGVLLGSVGGGMALGAKKHGAAMKHEKQGAAMKHGAAMQGAHMTG